MSSPSATRRVVDVRLLLWWGDMVENAVVVVVVLTVANVIASSVSHWLEEEGIVRILLTLLLQIVRCDKMLRYIPSQIMYVKVTCI